MKLYNNINNLKNFNIDNLEIIKDTITDNYNICFIIGCKYYRNYVTYIKYYVDNIIKYYSNYLIIIVDNESTYIDDLIQLFNFLNYKNIIILSNNIECKFEIGGYKLGILYLFKNNLIDKYDYYVFTQDNFVLKNKYDFNILNDNNIYACAINVFDDDLTIVNDVLVKYREDQEIILKQINLFDNFNKTNTLTLCNSFILHKSRIIPYYNYIKDFIIKTKIENLYERILPSILYELNNHINFNIDGYYYNYDNNNGIYLNNHIFSYFEKRIQQK
jgi:hypothetical protein